jgi:hypothetical protein
MNLEQLLAQTLEELRLKSKEFDRLSALLAAASPGGGATLAAPVSIPAPPIPAHHTPLPSPTTGGSDLLLKDQTYWGLLGCPLSFSAPGVAQSFSAVLAASLAAAKSRTPPSLAALTLMEEKTFYNLATSALPGEHVQVVSSSQEDARSLFDPGGVLGRWTLNRKCRPELALAVSGGGTRPVFQGEIKSVDPQMLGQALYYLLLAMAAEFFPALRGQRVGGSGARRIFYALPPLGYALLAFPHVGYFVSVEMVGKALVAPCSLPFFLDSEQHKAAAASLPTNSRGPPVWELDGELLWQPRASLGGGVGGEGAAAAAAEAAAAVLWSVSPRDGKFRKLLRADARSSEEWAEMFAVYERLREVLCQEGEGGESGGGGGGGVGGEGGGVSPPPSLIRGARLLYGANEALVEMPGVPCAGTPRCASNDEATGGGPGCTTPPPSLPILTAVAQAMAWLACRARILYTDLRGPNVLIPPAVLPAAPTPATPATTATTTATPQHTSPPAPAPAAWLIDYDDCVVVEAPVGSVEALKEALDRVERVRVKRRGEFSLAAPGFAQRFLRGDFPHLERALKDAFERLGSV